ncbi:MAG TPA: hypothetical protein VHP34_05705 [Alphaproteobacteria bacterium]|nr:hypothetical protein [Alphaproteobacteria bacterium]
MIGKIFGAVIIIALLVYAFTVMNKTTDSIEAEIKQAVSIQEQLEKEGLPPQPAQPPSSVTTTPAEEPEPAEQQP